MAALLTTDTVAEYVRSSGVLSDASSATEVGGGNLNYAFRVSNATQSGSADAAAQWQTYLSRVEQLQQQLPSGGSRVAQQLKLCVDQLGLGRQSYNATL